MVESIKNISLKFLKNLNNNMTKLRQNKFNENINVIIEQVEEELKETIHSKKEEKKKARSRSNSITRSRPFSGSVISPLFLQIGMILSKIPSFL